MSTPTPSWFTRALGERYDVGKVFVDGAPVAYRAWGKRGLSPVVLVHGGAAHAGWWDHVGPHLTAHHRVIAVDLTGHGDSGRREQYSLETWSDEVLAVAREESDTPAVLFGHSLGGFVVLTAARRHGAKLVGVAAIDSPFRATSPESSAWASRHAHLPGTRTYPDRESILARFRTLPEDDSSLPYIRDHVASSSVIETEHGWAWKFDPHIFLRERVNNDDLVKAACKIALIRGERGISSLDLTEMLATRLGGEVPVMMILDSGHHIMLDQPIALIAALQTLLGQWRTPQ